MTSQTWIIACLLALLAFTRKATGAAIGILVLSMLVWPEYLRVPLGLFEVSVPRMIALVLVVQAYFRGQHRKVVACGVDRMVLAIWAWTIVASILASAPFPHINQMIGRGLDTVLMYFVVRLYITSAENLEEMARWLIVATLIMGLLGVIETVTAHTPYSGMEAYRAWSWIEKGDEFRHGFKRAKGSTSVHIYFGLAMMIVTGILWSINKGVQQPGVARLAVLAGLAGALSSMSSGPWLGCVIMFFLGLYRYRTDLIRPSIILLVLVSLVLEVASDRHFYNLIDYMALDSRTAWYRTRLLEVAASRLSEFWLIGVGAQWPHHWGGLLDGRDHIDVVNNFLIVALYGGLPAMVLYVLSHFQAISLVIGHWRSGGKGRVRLVAFCLGAVLLALDFSSISVGLFGPPLLLSNILLALIVAVTQMRQTSEANPEAAARPINDDYAQNRPGQT